MNCLSMRVPSLILSVVSLILFCAPAFAWNDFGHMAVAGIAYNKLKPGVRERADTLVALNPYCKAWRAMVKPSLSESETNKLMFMLCATWPDNIKGDSEYKVDGLDRGYRPDGITSSLNEGYSDKLLHKYWHFVDLPFSPDQTKLLPIPSPNAETEIDVCRKTLNSSRPDQLKSYDLSWLLHLLGDVHQPLHCVNRITKSLPDGDSGGNAIKILSSNPPALLHSFWDEVLSAERDPQVVAVFVDNLPRNTKGANKLKTRVWVNESFKLCKSAVYVAPVDNSDQVVALTDQYKQRALRISRQRVAVAGERLGNILNRELR